MLRKREGLLAVLLVLSILLLDPWSLTRAGSGSGAEIPPPEPDLTLFEGLSVERAATDHLRSLGQGVLPCKKVLFLDDRGSDEFSVLKNTLVALGFEVQEVLPVEITAALIAPYDVVVFSLGWYAGGGGQRELTDAEAAALVQFVNAGKSLFLVGELGRTGWSATWRQSLNRIAGNFGITFKNNMLCSSASHLGNPSDPDGGVDLPIIENISPRLLREGVEQFSIFWGSSIGVTSPARAVARSDASSWRDTDCTWNFVINEWECAQDPNEPSRARAVLAAAESGAGRILAIGDSSWLMNGWIDFTDNLQLAKNAFAWLARIPSVKPLTAQPTKGTAPLRVRLTCATKDAGARIAEYHWDFGDGTTDTIVADNTTLTTNHTYLAAGTYAARCTIVDKSGCSSTSNPLSIAATANQAPVIDSFTARPTSGTLGEGGLFVTFSCTAHDPNPKGSIRRYRFDFGDGNTASSTQGTTQHSYLAVGTYNSTCTVEDNLGSRTTSTPVVITVNARPSITSFTATEMDGEGQCDNSTGTFPYSFTCSASDPEGLIARYEITFGDNQTTVVTSSDTTVTVQHSYLFSAGTQNTHTTQCIVYDNLGARAFSQPVTVETHTCD